MLRAAVLDPVLTLPVEADYQSPDGMAVRLLAANALGGLAQYVLGTGQASIAIRRLTVETLWYVLDGQGELWRAYGGVERTDKIVRGDSARIAPGVSVQVSATTDLTLLIASIPLLPGPEEAVQVPGRW